MAHIFALWTLKNAEHYFNSADDKKDERKSDDDDYDDNKIEENRRNYLLQPHPAQVVAVFLLLGLFDNAHTKLPKHLVQVRTGEGKSIIMAVTAIVLALAGFDVSCACYSSFLSNRDRVKFEEIFTSLYVDKHIDYGNFGQLCERFLNDQGDIRKQMENLIFDRSVEIKRTSSNRLKILLIDEVDVFFSREFYGKLYNPIISITDDSIKKLNKIEKLDIIKNLIYYIWANKAILSWGKLKKSKPYSDFYNYPIFQKWQKVIEKEVQSILIYAQSDFVNARKYIIKKGKIGYQQHDDVSFHTDYGYETLMLYFHEHANGNISKTKLEEKCGINIRCGSFSFAELPNKFASILGVTGTLEDLNKKAKQIINDTYQIKRETYMPSIYGKNEISFNTKKDIEIVPDKDFFCSRIVEEINTNIAHNYFNKHLGKEKRAVLVFFENRKILEGFNKPDKIKALTKVNEIKILTENLENKQKSQIIKTATASGTVLLTIKEFARGTDFICYDDRVNKNGGVHVLQTYLSEDISEEIQAKGRTARQGEQGSYKILLNQDDLKQKFSIAPATIAEYKQEEYYDFLHAERNRCFDEKYTDIDKKVKSAKENHMISEKMLKALQQKRSNEVSEYLLKFQSFATYQRTLILVDATGSMGPLLDAAKKTVNHTFERIKVILREKHCDPLSFAIKFVAYRNYSSEQYLLEASEWESDPKKLENFMKDIRTRGGQGNEAIEIGLAYAYEIHQDEPIAQIILIGDMPPNTDEEVKERRNRNESYWMSRGGIYAKPTYWKTEVAKLAKSEVKIHAFYLEYSAKDAFEEIAKRTDAQCDHLDMGRNVSPEKRSKKITDLLSTQVLQQMGGEAFVQAYEDKYA